MKKSLLVALAAIISIISVSARDIYSRKVSDLPSSAQNTLSQHFKASLSVIKIDKGFTGVSEYDVVLTDGTEISFDRNGNWKDIEVASGKRVPDALVPKQILDYVKKYNQNKKIVGIEKNRNNYEVELENGIEIKFDRAGNFLRYDN